MKSGFVSFGSFVKTGYAKTGYAITDPLAETDSSAITDPLARKKWLVYKVSCIVAILL